MRRLRRLAPHWRVRLLLGAAIGAIGYVFTAWLDFAPQPAAYVVMVVIVCAMTWLVLDTSDVPAATWEHRLVTPGDRVDEPTSDLRVLTSHQHADVPSEVLARRLVELARGRDPDLATELERDLAGARRLSPRDIDRILTRIEDVRDRR